MSPPQSMSTTRTHRHGWYIDCDLVGQAYGQGRWPSEQKWSFKTPCRPPGVCPRAKIPYKKPAHHDSSITSSFLFFERRKKLCTSHLQELFLGLFSMLQQHQELFWTLDLWSLTERSTLFKKKKGKWPTHTHTMITIGKFAYCIYRSLPCH